MENRNSLRKFINGGCLSRKDRLVATLFPGYPFSKNAKRLINSIPSHHVNSDNCINVKIKPYEGINQHVFELSKYLHTHLDNMLLNVLVHGSIATQEEIGYSDFDALVIIKNTVLSSSDTLAKTARVLSRARKFMWDMDPLQHHGWFVLFEGQLANYPLTYFPIELFEYSRSIFYNQESSIKIQVTKDNHDYKEPAIALIESIISKTSSSLPNNIYSLKLLLSEFMLLPTLYLQAKMKKAFFKKFSFELAKADFNEVDWSIMDTVSDLRTNWHYNANILQRYLLKSQHPLAATLKRRIAPKIPEDIEMQLTTCFYSEMHHLSLKFHDALT